MKYCHTIGFRVFAKIDEGENAEEIKEGLKKLAAIDLEKEKINIEEQSAVGFEDKRITIYHLTLKKDRHINEFFKHLTSQLGEKQRAMLKRQNESRLDENNHFFIRLDKSRLLNNEYFVVDHGECYHLTLVIACFPSTREKALETLENIL